MKVLKDIRHFFDLKCKKSNFKNGKFDIQKYRKKKSQTPEKNYITHNTANNLTSFSLFLSYIYTSLGLEGSNLKILRLGRAYIPKHSKLLISNEKSSCEKIRKYNIQMDVQKIDRRVSQISYVDYLHASKNGDL